MVPRIVRREIDAQHSTLPLPEDGRNVGDRCLLSLLGDPVADRRPSPVMAGIRPSGRKAIFQGRLQRRDLGYCEGQV